MPTLIDLFAFARLHTMIGTITGTLGMTYMLGGSLVQAMWLVLALLEGNMVIVGFNQMVDVEVDRVNKPWLPLASGAITMSQAASICAVSYIVGNIELIIGVFHQGYGVTSIYLYNLGIFLGILYSTERRRPVFSAFCITAVRGVLMNLIILTFLDIAPNYQFYRAVASICCFTTAIALYKDIPDQAGDLKHGVNTFALKYGVHAIEQVACGLYWFGILLHPAQWLYQFLSIYLLMTIQYDANHADRYQRLWIIFYTELLLLFLVSRG